MIKVNETKLWWPFVRRRLTLNGLARSHVLGLASSLTGRVRAVKYTELLLKGKKAQEHMFQEKCNDVLNRFMISSFRFACSSLVPFVVGKSSCVIAAATVSPDAAWRHGIPG
jgi:hypothetical protein